MKYIIASDIHGSAHWCRKLVENFKREGADKLILLGDLLYHGPRNALPEEYNPMEVAAMLNEPELRSMGVRGNCDAEIDQMVLDFPMFCDYALMAYGKRNIVFSHGHIFSPDNLPPMKKGDVFISGHIHVPVCEDKGGVLCLNPGSVSIPKEDSSYSYLSFEDGLFQWKDMEGKVYKEYRLED